MDNQPNTPELLVNPLDQYFTWSRDEDNDLDVLTIHGNEPTIIAFTPAALLKLGQQVVEQHATTVT
jgi:hypothetical protein